MNRFLFAILLVAASSAFGQSWPTKPVRIIVPFGPGGASDLMPRLVAERLSPMWGQPVVIENRPGAAGNIGMEAGAKAAPDGYTLLSAPNGNLVVNPHMYQKLNYDVFKDLVPVTRIAAVQNVLVVHPDVPAKTMKELVALAKAQPGKLSYASPGVGTPQHIAGELLKRQAGIELVHVPYRGAVFTDVIGGRVTMTLQNMGTILPIVRQGQLRGLAVTSLKRTPVMPDLPTVAESGLPGFEATSWFGLMAPAGTPAPIVAKVYEQAAKIAMDPQMKAKLAELGLDATADPPDAMAAIIKADTAKWAKVIQDANIKAAQ